MFIKNLILKNYRNYEYQEFSFCNGVNILTGNNAQGKTNCAEAIFYLCTGYSPRATRDKQVIKYGQDTAKIIGTATSSYGNVEVELSFYTNANKAVKINGVPIKKIGELMGNINSVFFNPGELKLIQESPDDRRRFMDIALSQMSKRYFYALQKYRKVLQQRNDLLKSSDKQSIYDTLSFWDEQLAVYAETIIKERLLFIEKLVPLAKKAHSYITGDSEEISISLEAQYLDEEDEFLQKHTSHLEKDVKNCLLLALSKRIEKDIALGYTSVGPHRDDIKIKINNEDVRLYGSQGQQRTSALSLKLAELEVFKDRFNEYPVLILDDAFSELDKSRRSRLLKYVDGVQTIITCTDVTEDMINGNNIKIFNIKNGKIDE